MRGWGGSLSRAAVPGGLQGGCRFRQGLVLGFSCCDRLSPVAGGSPALRRDPPVPLSPRSPTRGMWGGRRTASRHPSHGTRHRRSHGAVSARLRAEARSCAGRSGAGKGGRSWGCFPAGRRHQLQKPPLQAERGAAPQSQPGVFWSLTARPWSCGEETQCQERP